MTKSSFCQGLNLGIAPRAAEKEILGILYNRINFWGHLGRDP